MFLSILILNCDRVVTERKKEKEVVFLHSEWNIVVLLAWNKMYKASHK